MSTTVGVDENGHGKRYVADRMSDIFPGKECFRGGRARGHGRRARPDPQRAMGPAAADTVTAEVDVGTSQIG